MFRQHSVVQGDVGAPERVRKEGGELEDTSSLKAPAEAPVVRCDLQPGVVDRAAAAFRLRGGGGGGGGG